MEETAKIVKEYLKQNYLELDKETRLSRIEEIATLIYQSSPDADQFKIRYILEEISGKIDAFRGRRRAAISEIIELAVPSWSSTILDSLHAEEFLQRRKVKLCAEAADALKTEAGSDERNKLREDADLLTALAKSCIANNKTALHALARYAARDSEQDSQLANQIVADYEDAEDIEIY